MKNIAVLATATSLAVATLSYARHATADAAHTVAASGATSFAAPAPEEDDTASARDPNPMGSVGIGVKLGMAGMTEGKLQVSSNGKSVASRVDARQGLHVALPLHFGGDGFGWMLEPYMSRSSISRTISANGVSSDEDVTLMAYGLYTGPAYNIHVTNPLYLGVGLGVKGAYVASNGFDYAVDAFARAPISATYYLANQFALVAEVGLGYGLSVFADRPRVSVDPLTNRRMTSQDAPQLGKAMTWDCTLGIRLP